MVRSLEFVDRVGVDLAAPELPKIGLPLVLRLGALARPVVGPPRAVVRRAPVLVLENRVREPDLLELLVRGLDLVGPRPGRDLVRVVHEREPPERLLDLELGRRFRHGQRRVQVERRVQRAHL